MAELRAETGWSHGAVKEAREVAVHRRVSPVASCRYCDAATANDRPTAHVSTRDRRDDVTTSVGRDGHRLSSFQNWR